MLDFFRDKTGAHIGKANNLWLNRGLLTQQDRANGAFKIGTRDGIYLESLNLEGENFPYLECDTATALASGTGRYTVLPLHAGEVVTTLTFAVSVASNTATLIKGALFTTAGVRLAISASTLTALDSLGPVATFTMTTPYTVVTTGLYYAAILSVAGTAGTLLGTAGVTGKATSTVVAGTEGSLADFGTTATIVSATAPVWVAFT